MRPFETEEYRGYTIELFPDEDAESPREWDNLGCMLCWHDHYNLGDEQVRPHDDLLNELRANGVSVILPLYLYDHSGLSMSTSAQDFRAFDSAGWDWGCVGVIVAYRSDILKEYGGKLVSPRKRELAIQTLVHEVEAYHNWLSGGCCGYVVEDENGEEVDSLWGIDDSDYALTTLLSA
jgi:hypothetical protein